MKTESFFEKIINLNDIRNYALHVLKFYTNLYSGTVFKEEDANRYVLFYDKDAFHLYHPKDLISVRCIEKNALKIYVNVFERITLYDYYNNEYHFQRFEASMVFNANVLKYTLTDLRLVFNDTVIIIKMIKAPYNNCIKYYYNLDIYNVILESRDWGLTSISHWFDYYGNHIRTEYILPNHLAQFLRDNNICTDLFGNIKSEEDLMFINMSMGE